MMITPKNNNLVPVTLDSFTFIGLSVNLKPLNNLVCGITLKSATHPQEITLTRWQQIIGVRLHLERCIAYLMNIMLQISNIIPTGWWLLFQNWDFYRIEDPDLHNLAVRKASSLLLISLDYLYQITCKYIPVVLLLHLKAKGSIFIINTK
jgi:hypothetical protein